MRGAEPLTWFRPTGSECGSDRPRQWAGQIKISTWALWIRLGFVACFQPTRERLGLASRRISAGCTTSGTQTGTGTKPAALGTSSSLGRCFQAVRRTARRHPIPTCYSPAVPLSGTRTNRYPLLLNPFGSKSLGDWLCFLWFGGCHSWAHRQALQTGCCAGWSAGGLGPGVACVLWQLMKLLHTLPTNPGNSPSGLVSIIVCQLS